MTDLSVVPVDVEAVVVEDVRVVVDVVDGQFDRGHDAAAEMRLGHVLAKGEEAGDVDVAAAGRPVGHRLRARRGRRQAARVDAHAACEAGRAAGRRRRPQRRQQQQPPQQHARRQGSAARPRGRPTASFAQMHSSSLKHQQNTFPVR